MHKETKLSETIELINRKNVFLIYGSSYLKGLTVSELKRHEIPYVIGQARLESRCEIVKEIKRIFPTRILCISNDLDSSLSESNQIEAIRTGLIGELNLADVADEFIIHCTIVTLADTNEQREKKAGKEDESNINDGFATSLRITKEKLLRSYPKVLCLRMSHAFSADLSPNSLISQLLINHERISNTQVSLTIVADLWPILLRMSDQKLCGMFNFANPGTISFHQILEIYKNQIEPSLQWTCSPGAEPASQLNVDKLLSLNFSIPNCVDSIQSLIVKMAKKQALQETQPLVEIGQKLDSKNYQPRNILITGGAGFIGSHVTVQLAKKYPSYNIVVLDILDYCSNLKNLSAVENQPNFKFVKGDIRDFDLVKKVFDENKIDTVMHFAAQSHVDVSLKNSLIFTEVNVVGTHVLLECSRLCKVRPA